MMSQTLLQKTAFTKNILPNISKNKSSQTMKLGQLMENIHDKYFLKNRTKMCLRLFNKTSKLSISLDQQSELLKSLFSFYVQVEVYYQNLLKLRLLLPNIKLS